MQANKIEKLEYKVAFYIFTITFFIISAITSYSDLQSLTIWTVNFWDTLYTTGDWLNFYAYSAENIYSIPHTYVGSDILIYLPWAIWNIPLWGLQRFFGLTILEHQIMMFYSKLYLILLTFGCACIIRKIGSKYCENEHVCNCVFLFMTGFFTLTSVGFIGQNDIQVIFVLLLAVEAYIKGNLKKFLLYSALSVAFKPYFIFAYIVLVLLREKRVHCIALYGLSVMSIYILQKIPFWNAPMYRESMEQGPTMEVLGLMMQNVISLTPHMVSVFVLGLLVIYVLAYFDDWDTNDYVKPIYYVALTYICFFLFVKSEIYRPLYLFVFLYLVIMIKPNFFRIGLWLEMIATACFMYYYLYNGGCFCEGKFFVLPRTNPDSIGTSLSEMVKGIMPTCYTSVCMAVLLMCLVLYAVIYHPKFHSKSSALNIKEESYLIVLRSVFFVFPYWIAILLRYI